MEEDVDRPALFLHPLSSIIDLCFRHPGDM
jgi:hypothetical protein